MLLSRDLLQYFNRERWQLEPDWYRDPLQAGLRGDPWRIIVASVVIEQCNPYDARIFLPKYFALYPHPKDVQGASIKQLTPLFPPTVPNLRRIATANWITVASVEFRGSRWNTVANIRGITNYVQDALYIFCLGHYDLSPRDPILYRHARALRECYLGSEVVKPKEAQTADRPLSFWEKVEELDEENKRKVMEFLRE
jgi:hypothetical protein